MKVQLVKVREAPAGFGDDVLALVDFSYEPDQFAGTLEVTRYHKKSEKEFVVAKVANATGVMIIDANLRDGKHGPWIAVQGINVPDSVRAEVAKLALAEGERLGFLQSPAQAKPATGSWTAPAGSAPR